MGRSYSVVLEQFLSNVVTSALRLANDNCIGCTLSGYVSVNAFILEIVTDILK